MLNSTFKDLLEFTLRINIRKIFEFFLFFALTKRLILFIMYIKTLKRRVKSHSISTETFRLVREMREKLLNMALESSHRDLNLG